MGALFVCHRDPKKRYRRSRQLWPCADAIGHTPKNASSTLKPGLRAASLIELELWDEAQTLQRDELLPAARLTLGGDHELTLTLD